MYCKKCGNRLPDDAAFCNNCGEKTGNIVTENTKPHTEPGNPAGNQTQEPEPYRPRQDYSTIPEYTRADYPGPDSGEKKGIGKVLLFLIIAGAVAAVTIILLVCVLPKNAETRPTADTSDIINFSDITMPDSVTEFYYENEAAERTDIERLIYRYCDCFKKFGREFSAIQLPR